MYRKEKILLDTFRNKNKSTCTINFKMFEVILEVDHHQAPRRQNRHHRQL